MSDVTINGLRVLEGVFSFPRMGVWHADVALDSGDADAVNGSLSVTSDNGTLALTGAAYRVGAYTSRVLLRAVGGTGGMPQRLAARYYRGQAGAPLTLGLIIRDILRDAGETLATTADAAVLNTSAPAWVRRQARAAACLESVLHEVAGSAWRVLDDGTVWVGLETYPPAPTFDFELLHSDKREAKIDLGTEAMNLRPGTSFTDPAGTSQRVSFVEVHIAAGASRVKAWYERDRVEV